ncbi:MULTISPECIES: hypothetical protein [unclassified Haloferax]|uniref:hypothetical protein n=1 Tax=unclassified Haloferax TaxID=2625095 RepID=UPI0028751796|nr:MULTISPECIES: hypothetical protein [unclassified Haloferax]MDS0243399.1 hypothetical protein [Haloferax sp. S2CR25]MDS0446520.1 hypothetical protein [Haloferax sp. S2CR25-2]
MQVYESNDSDEPISVTALSRDVIRPESALESILHVNPTLILDEQLLVIGRQVRLDSGVADLIAIDEFANVVVIEVKIGRSGSGSASEETILSQPQAYASSLSTYDYDALGALYHDYQARLESGDWDVAGDSAIGGTLQTAVEAEFGKVIDEHEYNTEQRMVVVAEEITQATAANARFLLEQGLHFQCTEVQRFSAPDEEDDDRSLLTSSVVVDYEQSRVRPASRGNPTYPELVAPIVEAIFPSIRSTVQAETLGDAFPGGLDTRGPELQSQHPDHPGGVVYTLAAKPDQDKVTVTIDNLDDNLNVVDEIQAHEELFTESGFTVKDNKRYRLVEKQWSVESAGEVRDRSTEIGEQFAMLVQTGHEILADSSLNITGK